MNATLQQHQMFSMKSKFSYEHAVKLYKSYPDILDKPVVLCGTHCDLTEDQRELNFSDILFQHTVKPKKMYTFEVSSSSLYNYEKPFLFLMRELMNDPHLGFNYV